MRITPQDSALTSLGMLGQPDVPAARQKHRALRGGVLILFAVAAASLPVALWAAMAGRFLPVTLWTIGVAGALIVRGLCVRGYPDWAGRVLVALVMALGGGLSFLDPKFADFGMGAALWGPVIATIFGDRVAKRGAWILTVALVLTTIFLQRLPLAALAAQGAEVEWVSGIVYASFTLLTVYFAHRLNGSLRQAEQAKITALHQLIEQMQSAVIRLSPLGETLFVSNSAETLFNCKRYELSAEGLRERIHIQDRPAYLSALDGAHHKGVPATLDVRMRRDEPRSGHSVPSYIWVELAISPVRERPQRAASAPAGFECFLLVRDITDRKNQEQDLRRARKQAQAASEAKSRFLATIGHELRTPLNAIVGFSDMMSNGMAGRLDEDQREYATLIHKSGMHLLDVVNMLLDMSRIEAGKFDLQLEEFPPHRLIDPCVQMVEPMARERNVTVVGDADARLPHVTGDERAYRQIVINLLSNAIKFSHQDALVRLDIKRQGGRLLISVADEGIGMAREEMARIGEPFYQAQSDAARRYEGTGLGLSIVKGLVELHEGELRVKSHKGQGTTMSVLMPLKGPAPHSEQKPVVQQLKPRAKSEAHTVGATDKKSIAR